MSTEKNSRKGLIIPPECAVRLAERISQGRAPGSTLAYDEQGVFFHGNRYQRLAVTFDRKLDTVRFISKQGRVPSDTQVIIPLFHGYGASYSHAGAMISTAMGVFISRGPRANRGAGEKRRRCSLARELSSSAYYFFASAEAIDFPFHGAGPEGTAYWSLDYVVEWLAQELRQLKAYQLPVVPVARSGAAGLIIAVAEKYPKLVDAMVLASPSHPLLGFEEELISDMEDIRRGLYIPNIKGASWHMALNHQLLPRWRQDYSPFGRIPALVLIGPDDPDNPPEAQVAFRELAQRSRSRGIPSDYLEIPGANHDVLAPRPDSVALKVYTRIYQFIREVTLI